MLVTALVMTVMITYSVEYITDEGYPWYITLLLGAYSGMLGVIATSDVFNLFVMLEVTGVSSYGLVMYYRSKAGSIVSGLKYAFIGAMGTTLYLLALAIVYNTYGTLNLVDISLKTHGYPGSYITSGQVMYDAVSIGVIMGLAFWTFNIKSSVFPNHFWLPDAHPAAPAPVSAMLSGLVVNTGAVGLFKVLYLIYGGSIMENLVPVRNTISLLVVSMGAISALVGSLLMLIQDDVKRLIAYSTVMNTGCIFMSIGVLSASEVLAFLYHTVIHSLAKSTLFLDTGVLVKYAGSRRMDDLAGLGKKHLLPGLAIGISVFTVHASRYTASTRLPEQATHVRGILRVQPGIRYRDDYSKRHRSTGVHEALPHSAFRSPREGENPQGHAYSWSLHSSYGDTITPPRNTLHHLPGCLQHVVQ